MNQLIVDGGRCLNMEDDRFEAKSALGHDVWKIVRPETVMVTVPLTKTSPMAMNLSDRIAELISKDNRITATEIATELGVSRNAVTSEIAVLKRNGKLERIGGPRGRWQLNRRWV